MMPEQSQADHVLALVTNTLNTAKRTERGLDKLTGILNGNGKDGVLTRIALLEDQIERLLRKLDDQAAANLAVSKVRWRAVAEIAIAAVAITGLAMQLMGG